jgi:hypothetical protein
VVSTKIRRREAALFPYNLALGAAIGTTGSRSRFYGTYPFLLKVGGELIRIKQSTREISCHFIRFSFFIFTLDQNAELTCLSLMMVPSVS